ncbi:MAG: c-type cytochrome [Spirochaetia bacterium]|nr:c-type cytochrome [Spirochaetia bacterium]
MIFKKRTEVSGFRRSVEMSLFRIFVISLFYALYLTCGKKPDNISPDSTSKELSDHKIISLSDAADLTVNGENPLESNPEAIAHGKGHYAAMCVVCHGENARGNVGPDLLDDVYLHGEDNFSEYKVLMGGISTDHMKMNPPRGKMPGYKNILGPHKVLEIMAWLADAKKNAKD